MYKLLSKDYGEYMKGYFVMSLGIRLEDGISPEKFSQEELATFVHEYIHFLQNITTTYGVSYFNSNSKFIQLFVSESYKYDKNIPCPILLDEKMEDAYVESQLKEFYLGSSKHKKIHHIDRIEIEKEEVMDAVVEGENMQTVNIYYDNSEYPYIFGTVCIEESIAYLIESEKFNGTHRNNEFPYNACELVCKSMYPNLEIRKETIVALAELSLMHYHSGRMFVELLAYMVAEEKEFNDTDEVISYFRDKILHLYENYEDAYKETENTIDFLYPKNTPFDIVNEWIKKEMKRGFECRKTNHTLLARFMDLTTEQSIGYLSELIEIFGYPVICDEKGEIFSEKYNLSLALVPIAIFNIYMSEDTKCYLYRYCQIGNNPTFDVNCIKEPWRQSEKDILCPFALFWYYYSLSGKSICKN